MDEIPPPLYSTSPAHPQPAPRRKGWIVYSVIVTLFLFVSVLANLVLLAVAFGSGSDGLSRGRERLMEEVIQESDDGTRHKIAVIYVTGIISTADGMIAEDGMVGYIQHQLRQAVEDKHVKAIVLRINSPGGEVVASDMIYNAVVEARKSKPVLASMDTVGASGAYYIAVGADQIFATDMTITGSIGVIMQTLNFTGLMQKVGIQAFTFKSGKFKDLMNATREPTEEEKQFVQGLVMEVYEKFVGIVAKERKMDVDKLKNGLADGRILSGEQARQAGFVDKIGYFEDALKAAKAAAGIQEARIIRYVVPFSLRNFFRLMGESEPKKISIEIAPNQFKMQAGRLYLLPPYMFQ